MIIIMSSSSSSSSSTSAAATRSGGGSHFIESLLQFYPRAVVSAVIITTITINDRDKSTKNHGQPNLEKNPK